MPFGEPLVVSSHLKDYDYALPSHRIAKKPLRSRDLARLLCYTRGESLYHTRFQSLPEQLPKDALLVYNDSKVIPARLKFRRSTGAVIEVLLLQPVEVSHAQALTQQRQSTWTCLMKNAQRWQRDEEVLSLFAPKQLSAYRVGASEVRFVWPGEETFQEILVQLGEIPLPPYLKRAHVPEDREDYQTLYAKVLGSVAAPTAGLHFTERVWSRLRHQHQICSLTLHVGAATFLPVHTSDIRQHTMHDEYVSIPEQTLRSVAESRGPVVAVGTTTLRTLESVYWYGVRLHETSDVASDLPFDIPSQHYRNQAQQVPVRRAFEKVLDKLKREKKKCLTGRTSLFLYPPYQVRTCRGLITNFHQPCSTLLMLVAAWLGSDWRRVYEKALCEGYRFLSYGDACFLLR